MSCSRVHSFVVIAKTFVTHLVLTMRFNTLWTHVGYRLYESGEDTIFTICIIDKAIGKIDASSDPSSCTMYLFHYVAIALWNGNTSLWLHCRSILPPSLDVIREHIAFIIRVVWADNWFGLNKFSVQICKIHCCCSSFKKHILVITYRTSFIYTFVSCF